ncbi:hypothetical protein LTR91_000577 [Friedmanniomyces endolithicus]|uniref:Uncharacterized protein n=1 Tax=Friedmanniomyces endolithicus TaxID=329885 RepID=A0A4U0UDC5_9PEZI|nr:hypothetical protein LTS09_004927 [Friedmanniomyces endolithicus]KAK0269361.1 hypothetical protein LTR35_014850 [Friedmanniomyces endolithicus]KAK0286072.1 hypothetical protein LTS00_010604 [Friedmanniomyces endolithicus]KAK0309269.1 hypothetical protein LTR01_004376 [Friedmanniomyces endolithicus]KAK0311110.1 hypothetical protein LTR82_014403 [Friedmanniomyces endolithicus]
MAFANGSLALEIETRLQDIIRHQTTNTSSETILHTYTTALSIIHNVAEAWRQVCTSMPPTSTQMTGSQSWDLADAATGTARLANTASADLEYSIIACFTAPFRVTDDTAMSLSKAQDIVMAASKAFLILSGAVDRYLEASEADGALERRSAPTRPLQTDPGASATNSEVTHLGFGPPISGRSTTSSSRAAHGISRSFWTEEELDIGLTIRIVFRGLSRQRIAVALNEHFGGTRTRFFRNAWTDGLPNFLERLDSQCDPAHPAMIIDWRREYQEMKARELAEEEEAAQRLFDAVAAVDDNSSNDRANYYSDHDALGDLEEMMRRDELGQLELDEADLEGVEEEQDTEQRPLEGAELV